MAEQESVLSQLCAGHYAETEAPSETQGACKARFGDRICTKLFRWTFEGQVADFPCRYPAKDLDRVTTASSK